MHACVCLSGFVWVITPTFMHGFQNYFYFLWGGGGKRMGVSVHTWTNVSNGTLTLQRKHLCKIILKSMHIYRSYGPEKLIYVTFKCDLDIQPT